MLQDCIQFGPLSPVVTQQPSQHASWRQVLQRTVMALLAPIVSLLTVPAAADDLQARIQRAYDRPDHFIVRPAKRRLTAEPFTIQQFPYPGDILRPDDTVGEKLSRILSLAEVPEAAPAVEIIVLDQSVGLETVTTSLPALPADTIRICAVIPLPEHSRRDGDEINRALAPLCSGADTYTLTVPELGGKELAKRTRLAGNLLNEIGHRIAAESFFVQLIELEPIAAWLNPPPLYRHRINIHPKNNERLASHQTSDS